jgi:glutamate racemase
MLVTGVDTVVLGCTHYPFVKLLIAEIVGDAARIIDPAPAVAQQTARVLAQKGLLAQHQGPGEMLAFTSGDPDEFAIFARRVFGHSLQVKPAVWGVAGLGAA